jgi:hypothetical protein
MFNSIKKTQSLTFNSSAKYAVQSIKKKFGHENAHVVLNSLQVYFHNSLLSMRILFCASVWSQL